MHGICVNLTDPEENANIFIDLFQPDLLRYGIADMRICAELNNGLRVVCILLGMTFLIFIFRCKGRGSFSGCERFFGHVVDKVVDVQNITAGKDTFL